MTDWDEQLAVASESWRRWCRALEETGAAALAATMTHDEIDLAEGLRYLGRLSRLALLSAAENEDSHNPYLWPALDPHLKMGGDNPQGLYLSGPINGSDTFRLSGSRGSAPWVSILIGHTPAGIMAGHPPFGNALFAPDLEVRPDGSFEVIVSPDEHAGNWIPSDVYAGSVLVRQFFGTPDDVVPMTLVVENLTSAAEPAALTVATAAERLDRAAMMFSFMVPMMQSELIGKASATNSFRTDVGDPTSMSGGVPGGNAVTARWRLEPDEALLVDVTPPTPCAYWDVQVGNGWYESFDYRSHFSGITCDSAQLNDDGSVTFIVSQRDPGVANWLEAAHHREGHIAIRWQLTDGALPIPQCRVVKVTAAAASVRLPAVTPEQRNAAREELAHSVVARFGH